MMALLLACSPRVNHGQVTFNDAYAESNSDLYQSFDEQGRILASWRDGRALRWDWFYDGDRRFPNRIERGYPGDPGPTLVEEYDDEQRLIRRTTWEGITTWEWRDDGVWMAAPDHEVWTQLDERGRPLRVDHSDFGQDEVWTWDGDVGTAVITESGEAIGWVLQVRDDRNRIIEQRRELPDTFTEDRLEYDGDHLVAEHHSWKRITGLIGGSCSREITWEGGEQRTSDGECSVRFSPTWTWTETWGDAYPPRTTMQWESHPHWEPDWLSRSHLPTDG